MPAFHLTDEFVAQPGAFGELLLRKLLGTTPMSESCAKAESDSAD